MSRPKKRLSKPLAIALYLAFLAVAVVLLAEVLLWVFFRQGEEPEIAVDYKQDIPGLAPEIHFAKDGHGFRTLSLDSVAKPEGTLRVLCIGASTTEQGAQSTEDMWSSVLEGILQEKFADDGVEVEVAAYAKGGAKMHEMMHWAKHRMPDFEPDVVVCLFGMNSLMTDRVILNHGGMGALRPLIDEPPPLLRRIAGVSQIARYIHAVNENRWRSDYVEKHDGINYDLRGLALRPLYWQRPLDLDGSMARVTPRLFREKCDYLVEIIQGQGARPVLLAQPLLLHSDMDYTLGDQPGEVSLTGAAPGGVAAVEEAKAELAAIWFTPNTGEHDANGQPVTVRLLPGEFRRQMSLFNAEASAAATAAGAAYVPLDDLIAPGLENFFDDCHFTDLGSRRVAEAIAPAVGEELRKALAGE